MSGAISFTSIPPNLRVPLFYAEFDNTQAGASQPVQRALILGQTTATVVSAPTYVADVAQAASLWGAGSQIAAEIAAYRANDPIGELWAVPYSDAGGSAAATGSITATGTATAAGTLSFYIAGQLVQVAVASGDAQNTIAASINSAIGAFTYGLAGASLLLPVTAGVSANVVTTTARNKGTLGNSIPILLNYRGTQAGEVTPPGVTIAITAMSGGTGDPDLSTLATLLGSTAYDFILNPYAIATPLGLTTAMMSDQAGRWSYASAVYGHVFSAKADTVANLLSLGGTLNDQHLTVLGVNSGSPTPSYVWGAAFMGAIAPSLKADPARPLQTLPISGVLPAPIGSRQSFTNKQSLLTAGIACAQAMDDSSVQVLRAVTTYQTNRYGQADQSYLDTETLFTLMSITRSLKGVVTQKFGRHKLADDGTRLGFGSAIVTPKTVRGELIAQYATMETAGLVENAAAFAAGLIVQRNQNDPSRLDVLFDPYLISGLRIFAVLNQFRLRAA